jgi:hypothetical protein
VARVDGVGCRMNGFGEDLKFEWEREKLSNKIVGCAYELV